MTHSFATKMPVNPPGQKHAEPRRSDNFGYLASLTGNRPADTNLQWYWNNPKNRTEAGGGVAYGAHYAAPGPNGYTHIVGAKGILRRMTKSQLHRNDWAAGQVAKWRRGPSKNSPRPRTYDQLCAYVRKHGGTILGELKSQAFATLWIMKQLVATARRHNHAPWFKALFNMKQVQGKCAATVQAGGQFALIFGRFVAGRQARLARGHAISAAWAIKPTRIW